MGEIQDYINEHLTINHSFVKSIQVTDKSDDDVIIPRGYNMRFINCQVKKLTARESAIHFIGGNADVLRLAFCIVSMDGVTVKEDIKATNCRINLKKIPEKLKSDDVTSSEMKVDGSIHFENTESFWHEVEWKGSKESLIDNSRVEFHDCKTKLDSELKIHGSEVYFILGDECSFSKKVEIKDLEPKSGEPEMDMDSKGKPSKNRIRGSAGVGPGSIVNFKKVKKVELKSDATFEVTKSELNFFDIEEIKSDSKPIATYKEKSTGKISDCKLKSDSESCIVMKKTGHLHITKSEFESKSEPTILIEGPNSSCTISEGKFKSEGKECFSLKDCFVDMYKVEKIESDKKAIKAENSTVFLSECEEIKADEETFDLSKESVLEVFNCKKLKGKTIFKGDKSSFLVRGDEIELEAQDKEVDGSGVFVVTQKKEEEE